MPAKTTSERYPWESVINSSQSMIQERMKQADYFNDAQQRCHQQQSFLNNSQAQLMGSLNQNSANMQSADYMNAAIIGASL